MDDVATLFEHRIPDAVVTADLPVRLAAEIDFLAGRVDRWSVPSSDATTDAVAARSLALVGRDDAARAALANVDVDAAGPLDLAAAAWAASRVGGPTLARLLTRLAGESADFLEEEVPVGPRQMYVGLLHAATGDLDAAIAQLTAAVAVGDARAPLWGALCRLELGRVLRTAEAVPVSDVARSASVLTAARTFFAAGGYQSLLGRVAETAATVPAVIEAGRPARVGFGVQPIIEVRASKGLVAVRHLVANGHRVVSAAELARVVDGDDASDIAEMGAALWSSGDPGPDIDAVDASARIRTLFFDDTTRSRVSKLLRRTISKLAESHRLVGAHLDASVTTGHGCRYLPAGAPVRWTTGAS